MTRNEAIAYLKDFKTESWDGMPEETIDVAIKALEQEPKWIPVNERVPKDCRNVLVTIAEHGTTVTYVNFYIPTEERWSDDCEVIAWMPLPDPYKQGDKE